MKKVTDIEAKCYRLDPEMRECHWDDELDRGKSYCVFVSREHLLTQLSAVEEKFAIHIHAQHLKDCLNREHPSFFDSTPHYEMVLFKGLFSQIEQKLTNPQTLPHLIFSEHAITFFAFENLLLIVHDQTDLWYVVKKQLLFKGKIYTMILDVLYTALHAVIEQFLSLRLLFQSHFKQWQRLMLNEDNNFKHWNALVNYKTAIGSITALCEDMQETLEEWRRYTRYHTVQPFMINLNDLDEHVERAVCNTEKLTHNLDTLIQLHFSALSHRNNEILRMLAIISAIFLPLTLITGIFGMNFVHMPILQEHYAYYATMLGMFFVSFILILFFKKKGWL